MAGRDVTLRETLIVFIAMSERALLRIEDKPIRAKTHRRMNKWQKELDALN